MLFKKPIYFPPKFLFGSYSKEKLSQFWQKSQAFAEKTDLQFIPSQKMSGKRRSIDKNVER
jgi:uncharacterized NAD(P)/FAD-binding protein YdhS